MNFPKDQIEELKSCFGKVAVASEGAISYLLLEGVRLPAGCMPSLADLLLCPVQLAGYHTRLFFSDKVTSRTPLNWNFDGRICGRRWLAYSWQVPDGTAQRLAQMVLIHLKALR